MENFKNKFISLAIFTQFVFSQFKRDNLFFFVSERKVKQMFLKFSLK